MGGIGRFAESHNIMSTKDDLICKNCESYMPGIMKPHEGVCEFYVTKVIEDEIICEYFLPKPKGGLNDISTRQKEKGG